MVLVSSMTSTINRSISRTRAMAFIAVSFSLIFHENLWIVDCSSSVVFSIPLLNRMLMKLGFYLVHSEGTSCLISVLSQNNSAIPQLNIFWTPLRDAN